MPVARVVLLTVVALIAFAGNSLLCRIALTQTGIGAATFTAVRLISGALVLLLVRLGKNADQSGGEKSAHGNWPSALALFVYAITFSFAYMSLGAATGALLLFSAVQATMIGYGLYCGERFHPVQTAGLLLALAGLVGLLLPGLSAPPLAGALLMLGAGVAWGVYSLRGRSTGDPARVTAGNFLRAAPVALLAGAALWSQARWDAAGLAYAVTSGALASGLGYIVWYAVLPSLKATTAATVQLSVPALAALGGIAFLGESLSLRLALCSLAILGGIAVVITEKRVK